MLYQHNTKKTLYVKIGSNLYKVGDAWRQTVRYMDIFSGIRYLRDEVDFNANFTRIESLPSLITTLKVEMESESNNRPNSERTE